MNSGSLAFLLEISPGTGRHAFHHVVEGLRRADSLASMRASASARATSIALKSRLRSAEFVG